MALAHKKRVLENGVRIVGVPMPQRKSLALGIWIGVGGRYETQSQKGISH